MPAASPSPAATALQRRVHRALVVCPAAALYSWPPDSAPAVSSYPPARAGDVIHVLGDAKLSFDGRRLYETTIRVVAPWGAGKHYWIGERCVNAY
jgi:hypothetical protein